jgi:L-fuconolactonase
MLAFFMPKVRGISPKAWILSRIMFIMASSSDFFLTDTHQLISQLIDTHQHLWDLDKFTLPWLTRGEEPLGKNHTVETYKTATQDYANSIAASIYMEVDVIAAQKLDEAAYVFTLCADPNTTLAGAVVGGDPSQPDFADYLAQLIAMDNHRGYLKGVRQVLHGGQPADYCLSDAFIVGIELLGKHNLSFDFCLRPDNLKNAATLAKKCPNTRFILDHCGNPLLHADTPENWQIWRTGMEALADCPNVVACKISGIIAQAPEGWTPKDLQRAVTETREVFGPERVMFASDWPVCTLKASLSEWIEALRFLVKDWPEFEQHALFAGNARRVYSL